MAFPNDLHDALLDILNPATLVGALFYAVLFALFAWLGGRAVRLAVNRSLSRHGLLDDKTAVSFLGQLARLGIYIFVVASYAYLIPVLRHLGAVSLAGVGVASVVVGLAAQNTLGNLIAGISLVLYRPFKLGDRLQINAPTGPECGVVESLSLGYTTICTDDHRRILIPNSVMASQTSINTSAANPAAVCIVTINISLQADIDKARFLLTNLAKADANASEVLSCRITTMNESGIALSLTARCLNATSAAVFKSDLLESAKKQFEAQGIPLAYAKS